jgi:regulator of sirC expression with transglutaminase-like and TPR domain
VKRRTLLALPAVLSCSRPEPRPSARDPLLAIGAELGEIDAAGEAFAIAELARITGKARAARQAGGEPVAISVGRLSRLLFEELGFEREVESTALTFVLLPLVLQNRRGSCVGLGSLYLALARSLGLPLSGVLRPGHFHVRAAEAGTPRNFELLRRGEVMPEDWYRTKYPANASASAYGRALTDGEVRGVVAFNVGNERRRQNRLEPSRRAYERALELFPGLAEAHASLGAVLHLLGDLASAERAYANARRIDPELHGLAHNLDLLERERAAR